MSGGVWGVSGGSGKGLGVVWKGCPEGLADVWEESGGRLVRVW